MSRTTPLSSLVKAGYLNTSRSDFTALRVFCSPFWEIASGFGASPAPGPGCTCRGVRVPGSKTGSSDTRRRSEPGAHVSSGDFLGGVLRCWHSKCGGVPFGGPAGGGGGYQGGSFYELRRSSWGLVSVLVMGVPRRLSDLRVPAAVAGVARGAVLACIGLFFSLGGGACRRAGEASDR